MRIALDEEAYRIAGHAHPRSGCRCGCSGGLEAPGPGFHEAHRRLRDHPATQVDDAEPRPAAEAVQEHVEVAAFFEKTCGDGGVRGLSLAVGCPGSVRSPPCHCAPVWLRQPRLQSGGTGLRGRPCDHPAGFRAGRTRGDDGHYGRRAVRRRALDDRRARVRRRSRTSPTGVRDGETVEARRDHPRGRPRTSCATPPRTSWRRPCRSCTPRPSWASARRSRTASTTTSTSPSPSTPRTSRRIEKRMQEIIKRGPALLRRVVTDDEAREELADEPYKLELDRPQGLGVDADDDGGRRGRRRRADHLRQPRREDRRAVLEGPLPRPAPAQHPDHPGRFKLMRNAAAYWRGQREEPAAAADLRHRVAEPGRAQGAPGAAGRGREARPPQARRRAGPVLASPRRSAPASRCSTPRAASSAARWRTTSPQRHEEAGYEFVVHPAHHQGAAVPRPPGTCDWYADGMYPPMAARRGHRLLPQAHELPDAQPDLPTRAARSLPRAAAAAASSSAPCTATRSRASCTA